MDPLMTSTPRPPMLPIDRTATPLRIARILILGIVQALVLLLLASLLDNLQIDGFWSALAMVAVLSVLNAVVWPFVIRVTLPLVLVTVGPFTFVLNSLFVWAAGAIVGGIEIGSFWTALVVALVMTIVNLAVGGMLNVDGDHVWRSKMARRVPKRTEPPQHTDVPGFLFVGVGLCATRSTA